MQVHVLRNELVQTRVQFVIFVSVHANSSLSYSVSGSLHVAGPPHSASQLHPTPRLCSTHWPQGFPCRAFGRACRSRSGSYDGSASMRKIVRACGTCQKANMPSGRRLSNVSRPRSYSYKKREEDRKHTKISKRHTVAHASSISQLCPIPLCSSCALPLLREMLLRHVPTINVLLLVAAGG